MMTHKNVKEETITPQFIEKQTIIVPNEQTLEKKRKRNDPGFFCKCGEKGKSGNGILRHPNFVRHVKKMHHDEVWERWLDNTMEPPEKRSKLNEAIESEVRSEDVFVEMPSSQNDQLMLIDSSEHHVSASGQQFDNNQGKLFNEKLDEINLPDVAAITNFESQTEVKQTHFLYHSTTFLATFINLIILFLKQSPSSVFEMDCGHEEQYQEFIYVEDVDMSLTQNDQAEQLMLNDPSEANALAIGRQTQQQSDNNQVVSEKLRQESMINSDTESEEEEEKSVRIEVQAIVHADMNSVPILRSPSLSHSTQSLKSKVLLIETRDLRTIFDSL